MNRNHIICVAWALALLTSPSNDEALAQSGSDEVTQVIRDFLVPFSNRDIGHFIEFFADDATVFFPPGGAGFPGGRVQGKTAIAREFEAGYKRFGAASGPRPTIQPLDLMTQYFNDFAIVTFHLGTDAQRGRRTFVLRRVDSEWKIVHLHASSLSSD